MVAFNPEADGYLSSRGYIEKPRGRKECISATESLDWLAEE